MTHADTNTPFAGFQEAFFRWAEANAFFSHLLLALLLSVAGFILSKALAAATKKFFIYCSRNKQGDSKRLNTYASVLSSVVRVMILVLTGLQVLQLFGLGSTVTSLLTAAGIGGLALSFGAQSLVRDLVSGLFMLWENPYSVGDFVQIGSFKGRVEEFRPRITVLCALNGELHTIPNGTISAITNFSRRSLLASVEVAVDLKVDPFQALDVMRESLENSFPDDNPQILGIVRVRPNAYVLGCSCACRQKDKAFYEGSMLASILHGFATAGIPLAGGVVPALAAAPVGSSAEN